MFYLIIAAVWVVFGVLGYGIVFAHFQKEYKLTSFKGENRHRRIAITTALGGPLFCFVAIFICGIKSGLMYRSIHRGENHYE